MNPAASAGETQNCPSGFFQSLAIFAISLFGAIPAEAVSPVSSRIRSRIRAAMTVPGDGSWLTSRNASSSDRGSISAVKREKISRMRELSRL